MSHNSGYTIIAKGRKNACYAFCGSEPELDGKYIDEELGDEKSCLILITGNSKGGGPGYRPWGGEVPVALPEDPFEAMKAGNREYYGYGLADRSRMFDVEVWYAEGETEGDEPDAWDLPRVWHVKNGEYLSDRAFPEELYLAGDPCEAEAEAPALPPVPQVGETVFFGRYKQDRMALNKMDPIEWLVLDVDEQKREALLISRQTLDCKPFHTVTYSGWSDRVKEEEAPRTWADCTLRRWLNLTFLERAFTPEERERIAVSQVKADPNPKNRALGQGEDTEDRIFLLSAAEAEKYFRGREKERICSGTDYAFARGVDPDLYKAPDGRQGSRWLLRTRSRSEYELAFVNGGRIDYNAIPSGHPEPIRPALRVKY